MLTLYGISNCDTCKKARKWLDSNSVRYRFHDLRRDRLDGTMLARWAKSVGWQKLLNTRSTTWRGLAATAKQDLDEERAMELMLQHPTLIKRPVLENTKTVIVGFSVDTYDKVRG